MQPFGLCQANNAPINVKPHPPPPVRGGWGYNQVESKIPLPGGELSGQIPT